MKYIFQLIIALFLGVILTTSCSKNSSDASVDSSDDMSINISASISRSISEPTEEWIVGKSEFDHLDEVSVSVWTGSEPSYTTMVATNTISWLNHDTWVNSSDMKWYDSQTTHTIASVYPPTDITTIDMLKTIPYTANTDVLFALEENYTPTTDDIKLSYKHIMSRVDIVLTFLNFDLVDVNSFPSSIDVTAVDQATINYFTGEVSIGSDNESVSIQFESEYNTGSDQRVGSRIMIPQSVTSFTITIGSDTYTYISATPIVLEAGKYTRCNFTVSNGIELTSVSTNDWDEGGEYEFELQSNQ